MKTIKINNTEYPFRLTMWSLESLLKVEGYTFATIGNYLQDHMVEGIYSIVALGLNIAQRYGHKEEPADYVSYDTSMIDDMIGMDMNAFTELADFIGTHLGVKSDTETVESDPK